MIPTIPTDHLHTNVLNERRWEALPDPNSLPPKNEPKLAALYSDLRDKVSEEASIIQAVFPNPPLVMQVFLQRVFAQVVSPFLPLCFWSGLVGGSQDTHTHTLGRFKCTSNSSSPQQQTRPPP